MPVFSRWISSDERADSGGSLKEQKGMDRVKSAVIGAGQYGTAVIVQQFSASGIEVKIAADLDAEKACGHIGRREFPQNGLFTLPVKEKRARLWLRENMCIPIGRKLSSA